MAIRFSSSSLSRTTGLPTNTSCTVMMWARIVTDTNAFAGLIWGYTAPSTTRIYVELGSDGTTLGTWNGSVGASGTNLTVGTWYHIAMTHAGAGANNLKVYLNGVLDVQSAGNGTAWDTFQMGDGSGEPFNGRMAAVKVYSAVLTAAEIAAEMWHYVPIRTANLNSWYPLLSTADDEIDYSGNGNTWTVNGTPTTEEGPPIAWRLRRKRQVMYTVSGATATPKNVFGNVLAGPFSRGVA